MDYKVLASLHQPERGLKYGNMEYNKKKRIRIRFRKINYTLLLKKNGLSYKMTTSINGAHNYMY